MWCDVCVMCTHRLGWSSPARVWWDARAAIVSLGVSVWQSVSSLPRVVWYDYDIYPRSGKTKRNASRRIERNATDTTQTFAVAHLHTQSIVCTVQVLYWY